MRGRTGLEVQGELEVWGPGLGEEEAPDPVVEVSEAVIGEE